VSEIEDLIRESCREINEELLGGPPFSVGETVRRPDGRMVKITGGQYYSNGRISNFWHWREVLPGGKLGSEESGYGW